MVMPNELQSGRARQAAHDELRRRVGHVVPPRALCRLGGHHARARRGFSTRCATNRGALARSFGDYLRRGEISEAEEASWRTSPSAEAAVVMAGLVEAERGPEAAEEAMAGAAALQRMKLEKRLAYLGTLGNNAPFIGLLGTVIGIVQAFDELGKAAKVHERHGGAQPRRSPAGGHDQHRRGAGRHGNRSARRHPAVAAYNTFQRMTKSTLANTEVLSRILLAHLKAVVGAQRKRADGWRVTAATSTRGSPASTSHRWSTSRSCFSSSSW